MTQVYPRKLTTDVKFYVMVLGVGQRKCTCSVYMQFVSKSSLSEVVVMEPTDMEGHLYYSKPIYFLEDHCLLMLKKFNHHNISKWSYLYNTIKILTHCISLFNFISKIILIVLIKYSLNIVIY